MKLAALVLGGITHLGGGLCPPPAMAAIAGSPEGPLEVSVDLPPAGPAIPETEVVSGPIGAELDLRNKIRPGNARLGPGLFDPGDRLHQVEVGDERRVDQRVERGVIEVAPPLDGGVFAYGLRLQEGLG